MSQSTMSGSSFRAISTAILPLEAEKTLKPESSKSSSTFSRNEVSSSASNTFVIFINICWYVQPKCRTFPKFAFKSEVGPKIIYMLLNYVQPYSCSLYGQDVAGPEISVKNKGLVLGRDSLTFVHNINIKPVTPI